MRFGKCFGRGWMVRVCALWASGPGWIGKRHAGTCRRPRLRVWCGTLGPVRLRTSSSGPVVAAVRPVRPNGHGAAWEVLGGHEEQIRAWVTGTGTGKAGRALTLVKVHELLSRQGCQVPYPDVAPFRDGAVRVPGEGDDGACRRR